MAILKLLVLSYMLTTIYISFLLCENTRKKFESTNMGLVHYKILIFSDFSSMGVGLEKES